MPKLRYKENRPYFFRAFGHCNWFRTPFFPTDMLNLPIMHLTAKRSVEENQRIQSKLSSRGATLNSGATLNNHTFSITTMLQVVCVLDLSLKVSAPHSRNLLNVALMTFDLLYCCLNNNFQTKKIDVLRRSFGWKLISPNVFRDVQIIVWFVHHVTDCYCSDRRNFSKFF